MKTIILFTVFFSLSAMANNVTEMHCQSNSIKKINLIVVKDQNLLLIKVNGIDLENQTYGDFQNFKILIKNDDVNPVDQHRYYLEKTAHNNYVLNFYQFCDSYYSEEHCASDTLTLVSSENANCIIEE